MRWEHCSGEQVTWTELDSLRHLWVLQPLHPPSLESRVGSAPRSLPASPASLASPCQQTSLRQRAGLWYPAMLQRLHDRGVPGLAGGCGGQVAVLRKELSPWACNFGLVLQAELLEL